MNTLSPPSLASWYATLLGVITPVLLLGFGASALANRLVFAGWGLVAAVALALVLRRGFESWRGAVAILWPAALTLAVALAAFAALVQRHQEILDLGLRAVWPAAYTPLATRPGTFHLAALLALGVAVAAVAGRAFIQKRA